MKSNKFQELDKFIVPEGFRGRSKIFVQFWWIVQATLFSLSPQFAYKWRAFILSLFGAKIGKNVKIRASSKVTYPWKVSIGDNSWVGDRAELYSLDRITIGKNCCISQDCYLAAASHDYKKIDFPYKTGEIIIQDEAWLASGTFINPGIEVGYGSVCAARSVVTKDVPPESIVSGIPAKFIKKRIAEDIDD